MAILDIDIQGRHHQIACDDGQESHVRGLAKEIDRRVAELASQMGGQVSESTLLLLTALMLTDELNETTEHNEKLKMQAGSSSQAFEQAKQQEIATSVASVLEEIADEIEHIASAIESA